VKTKEKTSGKINDGSLRPKTMVIYEKGLYSKL